MTAGTASDGGQRRGPSGAEPPRLRLKALDAEDLAVVSAALQDAIVAVGDMGWQPDGRRFAMGVNRFMWEAAPDEEPAAEPAGPNDGSGDEPGPDGPVHYRTHCGVRFESVRRVVTRGLDLGERSRLLELLAVDGAAGAGGAALRLVFAGGAEIRLEAEAIACLLEDLGTPWPTLRRPRHEIEDAAESD